MNGVDRIDFLNIWPVMACGLILRIFFPFWPSTGQGVESQIARHSFAICAYIVMLRA